MAGTREMGFAAFSNSVELVVLIYFSYLKNRDFGQGKRQVM
jgi:hypothetical protein